MRLFTSLVCLLVMGSFPLLSEDDWHSELARSARLECEGRYSEAKRVLTRALEASRLQPENSVRASMVLWRLGWICYVLGEYDESRYRYRASMRLLERTLGGTHPTLAAVMITYAALCEARRELKEAERMRTRALEILEPELGSRHPDVLALRTDIARGYFQRREFSIAETSFRQILAAWPESGMNGDARLAQGWTGLGYLLLDSGRRQEAREAFERSLAITSRAAGQGHPVHLDAKYGLAMVQLAQGEIWQAESSLREAEAQIRLTLGPAHPLLLKMLEAHGRALRLLGRKNEAREIEKSTQSLRTKNQNTHSLANPQQAR